MSSSATTTAPTATTTETTTETTTVTTTATTTSTTTATTTTTNATTKTTQIPKEAVLLLSTRNLTNIPMVIDFEGIKVTNNTAKSVFI